MAGLSRMSGILYVAFIEMFETDRKTASEPFSVRSSTMNLLGPVVGILGQKYGVRNVSVFGGILGSLSAAACFFVDDIEWITVLWGGINGVGTALVCTLTTVVIGQYFDKYRTTACGLSFSGACIGSFIFPPLIESLLSLYGLQGSFLIIAGIILHCLPAAMILRKPSWIKATNLQLKRDVECVKEEKLISSAILKSDVSGKYNNSGVDLNYLRTHSELVVNLLTQDLTKSSKDDSNNVYPPKDEILREMEDVYTFVGKNPLSLKLSEVPPKMRLKFECETSPISNRSLIAFRSVREPRVDLQAFPVNNSQSPSESPKSTRTQCKPFILSKLNDLYVKDDNQIISNKDQSLHRKALRELRKLHKVYEAVRRRNIFASHRPDMKPNIVPKIILPAVEKKAVDNGLWENMRKSMVLHTNLIFLLISLCRAVHFIAFIPTVTIIVDYAMDKGLSEEDGIYIIAALSIGDLIGRLGLGWVTDRGFVSLSKYMLIGMIAQGMCSASLPLIYRRMTILPTIALYAMLQGSVFVRHAVLISKYMKSDEQSIAQGCVNFLAGLAGFLVPSFVGFFRDTIGSYDGIFYVNGAVGAATGFLWVFEPYLVHLNSDGTEDAAEPNEQKV